jgi:hypothetical protein
MKAYEASEFQRYYVLLLPESNFCDEDTFFNLKKEGRFWHEEQSKFGQFFRKWYISFSEANAGRAQLIRLADEIFQTQAYTAIIVTEYQVRRVNIDGLFTTRYQRNDSITIKPKKYETL